MIFSPVVCVLYFIVDKPDDDLFPFNIFIWDNYNTFFVVFFNVHMIWMLMYTQFVLDDPKP